MGRGRGRRPAEDRQHGGQGADDHDGQGRPESQPSGRSREEPSWRSPSQRELVGQRRRRAKPVQRHAEGHRGSETVALERPDGVVDVLAKFLEDVDPLAVGEAQPPRDVGQEPLAVNHLPSPAL